jgi:hypothetical protein
LDGSILENTLIREVIQAHKEFWDLSNSY